MQKNLDFIPGKPRRSEGPLLGEGSPVLISEESLVTVCRADEGRVLLEGGEPLRRVF